MTSPRYLSLMLALVILLVLAVALSLTLGEYPISLPMLWAGLTGHSIPEASEVVLWQLRLPRAIAAALIGAGLSAAGATYQAMLRNPLVSPDILGVSAGAGLGASFGIFLGLSLLWVQSLAFAGGLLAVACVYFIARAAPRHDSVLVLVLAGVAIGALLGAGLALLKLLADPGGQLPAITFWLMGGLQAITNKELPWLAIGLAIALIPLVLLRWRINLLVLPDDEARSLGQHPTRLRQLLIAAATLLTACAVAFSGIIGWVGLIMPHIARLIVGAEFSRLLPTTLLLGAVFLVLTDMLARTATGIELPLGLLTSVLGAPFFLFLLLRTRRPI